MSSVVPSDSGAISAIVAIPAIVIGVSRGGLRGVYDSVRLRAYDNTLLRGSDRRCLYGSAVVVAMVTYAVAVRVNKEVAYTIIICIPIEVVITHAVTVRVIKVMVTAYTVIIRVHKTLAEIASAGIADPACRLCIDRRGQHERAQKCRRQQFFHNQSPSFSKISHRCHCFIITYISLFFKYKHIFDFCQI